MQTDTLSKITVVVLVLVLILSVASLYKSFQNDGKDNGASDEYTLFFGMDPDATSAEKDALMDAAVKIATDGGYGYTCYWAEGGYTADDGTVVKDQQTLVFIMAHTSYDFVKDLANKVKGEFGLDTVMVETTSKVIGFI